MSETWLTVGSVQSAVRIATFLCDLGAHPEVAETQRHPAHGALVIVGGIQRTFAKSDM
jgi:hypothetical protein